MLHAEQFPARMRLNFGKKHQAAFCGMGTLHRHQPTHSAAVLPRAGRSYNYAACDSGFFAGRYRQLDRSVEDRG